MRQLSLIFLAAALCVPCTLCGAAMESPSLEVRSGGLNCIYPARGASFRRCWAKSGCRATFRQRRNWPAAGWRGKRPSERSRAVASSLQSDWCRRQGRAGACCGRGSCPVGTACAGRLKFSARAVRGARTSFPGCNTPAARNAFLDRLVRPGPAPRCLARSAGVQALYRPQMDLQRVVGRRRSGLHSPGHGGRAGGRCGPEPGALAGGRVVGHAV